MCIRDRLKSGGQSNFIINMIEKKVISFIVDNKSDTYKLKNDKDDRSKNNDFDNITLRRIFKYRFRIK